MSIEERVARGVALLDEKMPGWVDRIDVDRLNLSTVSQCVLGQLYGNYWRGKVELGLNTGITGFELLGDTSATQHGFNVGAVEHFVTEYAQLDLEWRRVIAILRQLRGAEGDRPCLSVSP